METEVKTLNKKAKIILIISAVIIILLDIFIFWFFNRKFDITFEVTDSENFNIKVKYNQTIEEKDIKAKEDLGENFIDWYEVISAENEKEVLAKDSFDFETKIKSNKKLKAVYKAQKEETIKITFDTKGGNNIESVTINKGSALSLPKNPTRSGYTFKEWTLKNGNTVKK